MAVKFSQSCQKFYPRRGDSLDSAYDTRDLSKETQKDFNTEIKDLLAKILETQNEMMCRLDILEKAVKENALDRGVLMAQNQNVRECKAVLTKVHHSVSRLTGEVEDRTQIEIAASLPMVSVDAAYEVEEKLKAKEYAEAMKIYLYQIKGTSGTVDDVLRKLMADELLILFNLDGRKNKKALIKLVLVNELLFGMLIS
ncbi:PREDICTED: uncharacterized protein LOC108359912 [Rhagoletis zephyria]|uniref:uncharacterized protein LOC108359912 n=1 Tax=Rhagoletis zephyria TaxID=28612 RepID=UPI0008114238|nr:PREDICTED: uncharacterized protein LOC108359912 [Rhagoletis zephyria]